MRKKKFIIFASILSAIIIIFIYLSSIPPYIISENNVKSIYCEYFNNGAKIIPVSEDDKKVILSEVSKMKKSNISGEVGTLSYRFVIELTDGSKFTFTQNTKSTILLHGDNFYRKIKAPKTSKFIKNFIDDNHIEL